MPRKDFHSLIKDVVDNLNNEDYKTTVNNRGYDLKNAENFLLEIFTKKLLKKKQANCTTVW